MNNHDDITLIVRECGERTADACVQLLSELFSAKIVHRISASSFHEALKLSLEHGLAQSRKWTLCIDADVLVLPKLLDFVNSCKKIPGNHFEYQALILDKFIRSQRPAGNHLYKTEMIPRALSLIPDSSAIRPESHMIKRMIKQGFPQHQSTSLIGVHDFEQSFYDIYSKALLHAHKHSQFMGICMPLWELLAIDDKDYRVALQARKDADTYKGIPELSRLHRRAEILASLDKMDLIEKPIFRNITIREVSKLIRHEQSRDSKLFLKYSRRIQSALSSGINFHRKRTVIGSRFLYMLACQVLKIRPARKLFIFSAVYIFKSE